MDRVAASVAARRHTAAQRVRLEELYLPYTACLGLRGSREVCERADCVRGALGGDEGRALTGMIVSKS